MLHHQTCTNAVRYFLIALIEPKMLKCHQTSVWSGLAFPHLFNARHRTDRISVKHWFDKPYIGH
ncbi:uncharacterized protein METZ01_LOCUS415541, partial [marine metagenome]